MSFEGEDDPNYQGGKHSTTCEVCDTSFEYYPSPRPTLYCGTCVEKEQWRHGRDISGVQNPRWATGPREQVCDQCGATFDRVREFSDSDRVFCGSDCRAAWLPESFSGEGHPDWAGGTDTDYGPGWRRVRRRALERDGRRWVVCGAAQEELGREPDVHHIVPVRAFVETPVTTVRDAHSLANVVSLGVACHRRAEFGHVPRERLEEAV